MACSCCGCPCGASPCPCCGCPDPECPPSGAVGSPLVRANYRRPGQPEGGWHTYIAKRDGRRHPPRDDTRALKLAVLGHRVGDGVQRGGPCMRRVDVRSTLAGRPAGVIGARSSSPTSKLAVATVQ